jgi:hypothetical protein
MVDAFVKEGMVGAEIGVFAGNFSAKLRSKNPSVLYLVDLFEGKWPSGDVDGNNVRHIDLNESLVALHDKYQKDPVVKLVKGPSFFFMASLPENLLDFIYLDGDHSYPGVKIDLEMARILVKPDGLIMGHDYSMNMEKAKTNYEFGVKKAVDEFCTRHSLAIKAIANDGCTSFCIVNTK